MVFEVLRPRRGSHVLNVVNQYAFDWAVDQCGFSSQTVYAEHWFNIRKLNPHLSNMQVQSLIRIQQAAYAFLHHRLTRIASGHELSVKPTPGDIRNELTPGMIDELVSLLHQIIDQILADAASDLVDAVNAQATDASGVLNAIAPLQ